MTSPILPAGHRQDAALEVRDLCVDFDSDSHVIDHLDLRVERGESVAIVGRSGSGKSTLLSCVLGLLPSTSGEILVSGELVSASRKREAARIRRNRVGMVFQSGALLPELSPLENVLIAGLLSGMSTQEANARALQLLEQLGVQATDRVIGQYSGGEQQRVALARALVHRPQLLLADEPTGSLDPETRDEVCATLRALPAEFDCGMVLVTHDPFVAANCTRVERLQAGRLTSATSMQIDS